MLIRALVTATALTAVVAISFAPTADAQIVDFSKYPDFSGQWKRPAGVGVQWDQTKPLGKQQAPLTPEYQAKLDEILANRARGSLEGNFTVTCLPTGMPRMMIVYETMDIIVLPEMTYIRMSLMNELRLVSGSVLSMFGPRKASRKRTITIGIRN